MVPFFLLDPAIFLTQIQESDIDDTSLGLNKRIAQNSRRQFTISEISSVEGSQEYC